MSGTCDRCENTCSRCGERLRDWERDRARFVAMVPLWGWFAKSCWIDSDGKAYFEVEPVPAMAIQKDGFPTAILWTGDMFEDIDNADGENCVTELWPPGKEPTNEGLEKRVRAKIEAYEARKRKKAEAEKKGGPSSNG